MRINAAVTECCGAPWELREVDLDEPRADEVLVRIVATGLCHTDASVREQYLPVPLPAVLGHEGAGVVERVGPGVTELKPGDHVVLCMTSCGKCSNCLRGMPMYCALSMPLNFAGRRLDGSATHSRNGMPITGGFFGQSSFATYALASERNAVKVPKDVPLELLGPLGCGINTGAGTVINTLRPPVGSSIAVFGAGAVGLAAVMAARVVGCTTIIAIDVHPHRIELAKELGATHVIDAGSTRDVVASVRAIGGGVQFTVDTTAVVGVAQQAAECLLPLGRCALVGVYPPGTELKLKLDSIFFGQTIGGVIEGDSVPQVFIPQLIELWRQGRFPFERLIQFYRFEDINLAAADSATGRTLKPVLRIGSVGG
jgi:aryl-alcohol dehydrogenase